MPDQAGKLSSERNGGYTRPKGPFHPAVGQGVNCPLSGPLGSGPAWEEKLFPQRKQCSCTVCVHITAELVLSSLFVQCCTLYNLTGFLAWLQSRQIHLYLSWILQNVVFNETSTFQNLLCWAFSIDVQYQQLFLEYSRMFLALHNVWLAIFKIWDKNRGRTDRQTRPDIE